MAMPNDQMRPCTRSNKDVNYKMFSTIRRPLQRASVLDLLDRPSGLKKTAFTPAGWSLQAVGLKVLGIGTQGPALKATGVATSCDQLRQVPTCCDLSRLVPICPDKLRPARQDILTGSQEMQGRFRRSWDLPEVASDHHDTISHGSETFRVLGPSGNSIGNDSKITGIMKVNGIGLRWIEMS